MMLLKLTILGLDILAIEAKSSRKKKSKPKRGQAMNAQAVLNSVVDQQKIRTAEIEIPVIAEDVLTYEGGELGAAYPDKTRLYYSADAIKDPDYLETVMRSPLQVQTHQKNTSEYNRAVDGWPLSVWWDDDKKRVMVKGVLHGEDNVKYAEENKRLPGFGTSAFISFLRIEKTAGTAPNGKPYDAVVRKAVNNHVAILPGIRDPKNVIVAMNAVEALNTDVTNPSWVADHPTWEKAKKQAADEGKPDNYALVTDIYKKMGGKINAQNSIDKTEDNIVSTDKGHNAPGKEAKKMDYDEFKGHMNTYNEEKTKEEEAANRIKNAIINELKSSDESSGKPVTSTATGGANAETSTTTGTATGTGKNGEESSGPAASKTETATAATASNALPSDEMVKDFSTHLGLQFAKTPTLHELASYVGVKETEPAALISALNAKREEFKKPRTEAQNSKNGEAVSLTDLMKSI